MASYRYCVTLLLAHAALPAAGPGWGSRGAPEPHTCEGDGEGLWKLLGFQHIAECPWPALRIFWRVLSLMRKQMTPLCELQKRVGSVSWSWVLSQITTISGQAKECCLVLSKYYARSWKKVGTKTSGCKKIYKWTMAPLWITMGLRPRPLQQPVQGAGTQFWQQLAQDG